MNPKWVQLNRANTARKVLSCVLHRLFFKNMIRSEISTGSKLNDQMDNKELVPNICTCGADDKGTGSDGPLPTVPLKEARRFMADCLISAGASQEFAGTHADCLLDADYRGCFSHGMSRLEMYCLNLKSRRINGKEQPIVINETPSCGLVDGRNNLGSVVGIMCMDMAIKKAKMCGIGLVVARNSTPYGCSAFYTERAAKNGFIGFACTNESPIQVVPRAKAAVFGLNPIAFAAPISPTDYFSLDMNTTAASVSKIEQAVKEGRETIPEGWATNAHGTSETNPEMALKYGRLLPLGSTETHGVFKGFGLAMMVDILAGILSGANYGPKVPTWKNLQGTETLNIGHCFMAINPEAFAPGFQERLKWLATYLRNLEPLSMYESIHVPGDPERLSQAKARSEKFIEYEKCIISRANRVIAPIYNVKPIEMLGRKKRDHLEFGSTGVTKLKKRRKRI